MYFRSFTLAFTPIAQCEDQNNKIKKVQRNGRECVNKIPNYEQTMQCICVLQKIGLGIFAVLPNADCQTQLDNFSKPQY